MKTEVVLMTPAMAKQLLELNTRNRPMERTRVLALRAAWQRGEWKLTHQGIAVGKNKLLLDGQHRLQFISELPAGTCVPIMVTSEMDDVFGVIDTGRIRSAADEMGIASSLAAVGAQLAAVFNAGQRFGFTTNYLIPFVEFARPHYEHLTAFCGTCRAVWSSAPVRSAAIVQMARGHNKDFVCSVYRSLVMRDITAMTPTAASLFSQVIDGKTGGARSSDLFVRSLRAFDSKARSASRITVRDVPSVMAEVREWLELKIDAEKIKKPSQKKAPQGRG